MHQKGSSSYDWDGQLDRSRLRHFIAWGGQDVLLHSVVQQKSTSENNNAGRSDDYNIHCDCGNITKPMYDLFEGVTLYGCAADECDFMSHDDGVDLVSLALPFLPGIHVSFVTLPPEYTWVQPPRQNSNENQIGGVVRDVTWRVLEEDATRVVLLVSVALCEGTVCSLPIDCIGDVFNEAWFPSTFLTILDSGDPANQVLFDGETNSGLLAGHQNRRNAPCPHGTAVQQHKVVFFEIAQPTNKLRPFLVRCTSIYSVIGFTGYNFSEKDPSYFGTKEWEIESQQHFTKTSRPLPGGEEYSAFISYRWLMGRFMLFTSMLVHFNHLAAVVISFGVTVLIEFIAGLVKYYVGTSILPQDGSQWYFSVPCRVFFFVLSLAVYGQVFSRKKLFLDRNCINQVDSELNAASLRCLPHVLSRCKSLLCLVDADYFKRLWCMFELAVYMKARKSNGKVAFVYSWQCLMFLVVFLSLAALRIGAFLAGLPPLRDGSLHRRPIWGNLSGSMVIFNVTIWLQGLAMYFVGRTYFQTEQTVREQSESFDVRSAVCGYEKDKPLLLDFIREQFNTSAISSENEQKNYNNKQNHEGSHHRDRSANNIGEGIETSVDPLSRTSRVFSKEKVTCPSPPKELRIDVEGGHPYDYESFLGVYGPEEGAQRWANSKPAKNYNNKQNHEGSHHRDRSTNNIGEATETSVDPLDVFNESVKTLLAEQVVPRFGRILPYSFVVAAYCMLETGYQYSNAAGMDVFDWLFYPTNGGLSERWEYHWFRALVEWPFSIFIRFPLLFYVQALIIKLLYVLETKFPRVFTCWVCWIPSIFFNALWLGVEEFVIHHFARFGTRAFFFGQRGFRVRTTYEFLPLRFFFDCFGTHCLAFQFVIDWRQKGLQVLAFLVCLAAVAIVFFVHEPSWFRKFRRNLWQRIVSSCKSRFQKEEENSRQGAENAPLLVQVESSREEEGARGY